MKNFTLIVTVEPQEEGGYLAVCENIKQCYAEGETYEEAIENLKDVAQICLELDAQREGVSLKVPSSFARAGGRSPHLWTALN